MPEYNVRVLDYSGTCTHSYTDRDGASLAGILRTVYAQSGNAILETHSIHVTRVGMDHINTTHGAPAVKRATQNFLGLLPSSQRPAYRISVAGETHVFHGVRGASGQGLLNTGLWLFLNNSAGAFNRFDRTQYAIAFQRALEGHDTVVITQVSDPDYFIDCSDFLWDHLYADEGLRRKIDEFVRLTLEEADTATIPGNSDDLLGSDDEEEDEDRPYVDMDSTSEESPTLVPVVAPPTTDRLFGIEIEFMGIGQDTASLAIRSALNGDAQAFRFRSTGYEHSDGSWWHLKTDSSCGLELAGPAMTWKHWDQFERILTQLHKMGASVTPRCGLHVHHCIKDFSEVHLRRLLLVWAAFEPAIFAMVKAERVGNRYCESVLSGRSFGDLFDNLLNADAIEDVVRQLGRYRSLNCVNYWRNGTVEMRLHHGTLQPAAIKFWVAVTQRLVEMAKTERDFEELEEIYSYTVDKKLEALKLKLKPEKDVSEAIDKVVLARNLIGKSE